MTTYDDGLLLREATLSGGRRVDIRLAGDRIASVEPTGAPVPLGVPVVELDGRLVLPAPVEVHAHLDKAYTADLVPNIAGDLDGAISGWLRYRASAPARDIAERAHRALGRYVQHGATAVRTHIDLGQDVGLRGVEAMLKVRAELADVCAIQIVAFAGNPLSGQAGADNRHLLEEALAAGADVVGGCPTYDPDPVVAIDHCLDLAAAWEHPVDLHVDEHLDPSRCLLEALATRVAGHGLSQQVIAGHCCNLSVLPPARVAAIADQVARAGIAVVSLPQTNLYLQGRDHPTAPPRGLTAVAALRSAGVTVAAGGDNLQDPFNPMGRADPLETASLLVSAGHETPEQAYAAVSDAGRRILGLGSGVIEAGQPAELLAVEAGSVREAVADAGPRRLVIHAGRIVSDTTVRDRVPPPTHPHPVAADDRGAAEPRRPS